MQKKDIVIGVLIGIIFVLFFYFYIFFSNYKTGKKNNIGNNFNTGISNNDLKNNSLSSGKNNNLVNKLEKDYYTYEDYLKNESIERIKRERIRPTKSMGKGKFYEVLINFYSFKRYPSRVVKTTDAKEHYNLIKSFATENCGDDVLCKVVSKKNLEKLKKLKKEKEEIKDGTYIFAKSLIKGKMLEGIGERDRIYNAIEKFNYYKTNISFDLLKENQNTIYGYIVYLKHNSEEKYYKKLKEKFKKVYNKFYDN